MKVLLQTSTFPPHNLGGAPKIAAWLAAGLRAEGIEVTVLCARVHPHPSTATVQRVLEPQRSWDKGRGGTIPARIRQCLLYRKDQQTCRELFDSFQPDIFLASNFFNLSTASWQTAEDRNIPIVFFPIAAYSPGHVFYGWGKLERLLFPLTGWFQPRAPNPKTVAALVTPSAFLLENYQQNGIRATVERVIRHGVPIDNFSPGKETRGPIRRILWIGRVIPDKGYPEALEAFAKLRSRYPALRLSIVGEVATADRNEIEKMASKLNITNGIDLLGHSTDEKWITEIYRQHQLFWMTSRLPEGLSLTLLEAMATGLPSISTSVGGNLEAITDNVDGIFVPANNPRALATTTADLIDNPERADRIGQAARNKAANYFSIKRMAHDFAELLNDVLRREASGCVLK